MGLRQNSSTGKIATVLLALALILPSSATGATYINKTRIIVNEAQREEIVKVKNEDTVPVLLQTWLDNGDIAARPENINVPFIITPTLLRCEPGLSYTFRLLFTGGENSLPADREQVYWLNVLEIPPKRNVMPHQTQLQMAFRSRIKVFYRPAALKQADINSEVKKLRVSLENRGDTPALRIDNPGPLHITFVSLRINNGKKIDQIPQDGMIAPFSSLQVPLTGHTGNDVTTLKMEYLDDFGELQTAFIPPHR